MKMSAGYLRILSISLSFSLAACVVIRSSSISESAGSGSKVNAEFSDYGVLHLTVPDTLTSEADAALAKQCQSGLISGVQTELSMREFLIVQYYTVGVAGTCK